MNVKKQFAEIVAILEANPNKKVSSIMDEVLALVSKKSNGGSNGSTVHKDADGNVVAVFCYYHKRWELVSGIEYGAKAGTTSGLNTMCKEGVSKWTKAQRDSKKAHSALLDSVANGEVAGDDIRSKMEEIAVETKAIIEHSIEGFSFDSIEEVDSYLASV